MSFFLINDIRLNLPMGWVPFQLLYLGPFSNVRCICVIGEVYYTRRTKILKRLVRKVIHKVEVPLDYFTSVEAAKAEARRQMDAYVKEYYRNH